MPVNCDVKELPEPDVVILPVPSKFQFPAVGDKAPPESPVIVLPTVVPLTT